MRELIKKIQLLLDKYSTGRNVLFLFIITQIIYLLMLLVTIPNVMNYANGMKLLDMQPTGYSADYAKFLFDSLGTGGRNSYLYNQIPLDMIYPFLFAVTYSLLLTYLFKKGFRPENRIHMLSIIPLFAGVFDYLENFGIILMLSIYPGFSYSLANVTSIFSILKSIGTTIFFVLLIIGIAGLFYKKFIKFK